MTAAPDDELAFAPALEQARSLRDGEIDAVELIELYLRRIDDLDTARRPTAYLTDRGI